jgi:hypothetical protein
MRREAEVERAGVDFIIERHEVVKWCDATPAKKSVQGELDDAAEDEGQQRCSDGQIQRIAHSSPVNRVSEFLS